MLKTSMSETENEPSDLGTFEEACDADASPCRAATSSIPSPNWDAKVLARKGETKNFRNPLPSLRQEKNCHSSGHQNE